MRIAAVAVAVAVRWFEGLRRGELVVDVVVWKKPKDLTTSFVKIALLKVKKSCKTLILLLGCLATCPAVIPMYQTRFMQGIY